MSDPAIQVLLQFFTALSDEERLRIAGVLAEREATIQEVATQLSMRPASVSKHVQLLAETGLIRASEDGPLTRWMLDTESLREQRKRLLARQRTPSPADEPGTPEWEQAVLRNAFDGEHLKEIPVNRRKKLVVLTWLAGRFEPDRRYAERDVNETINRHHPDHATLRRELVDYGLLQRERGVYWRTQPATANESD